MKRGLIFSIIAVLLVNACFFCVPAVQAAGATLFLAPASGTYAVGDSFNVKISVNSGGTPGINAAEGALKFDTSALQVTKVSDSGTVFKLWITEPTFSNTAGTITFSGGSPTAYTGSAGLIFSVTFKAKKAGEAAVSFTNGVVSAADGKGTNIFSGFGHAKFTIEEPKVEEPKKEVEKPVKQPETKEEDTSSTGILPPLPEISSETHSDENVWYSNSNPEFNWKLLSDLTGISYALNKEKESEATKLAEGVIESINFEDIEDGEWYFHVKYKNKSGWGKIAHRRVLIDSSYPESFKVVVDTEGDPTNPSPKLRFKTVDLISGIDYYQLKINNDIKKISPDEIRDGYYRPSALLPDEYSVNVLAVDMAGNGATSSTSFIVDALRAPIITDMPSLIDRRDELVIQGSSFYPDTTIKIYIRKQDKEDALEFEVKTDDQGNWSYFHKGRLDEATYEVWAKLIDERGAQSSESGKNIVMVESPSLVDVYGLFIILILIFLIILLVLYIIYQHRNFVAEKRRIRTETSEVKRKLSKIFAALREEVDELIELADKKAGLSESERRIKDKLQESLDISEEFISKEVDDVEKEISLPRDKEYK